MKMNKKVMWVIPLLLLISVVLVVIKIMPIQKFSLEDKYYGSSEFIEIETSDLEKLMDDKESFALFVYQPACVTSANFEEVLYDFITNNNIKIYKIAFSDIKDTKLSESIKYYPSFAIFNKGITVDYLDANSDNDLKYYKFNDDFEKWFTDYVLLKEVDNSNSVSNENNVEENTDNNNEETTNTTPKENVKEISLENVTHDKNKVNIYLFWGSTCPHCKEEFAFFDEIKEEYGDYYNLYTYEVWENQENAEIMNRFAAALGEEAKGVPYTVIGDVSFTGFGETSKEKFIEAIKTKHQNSSDIYFDKIKNKE